jgi:hypothetical protein
MLMNSLAGRLLNGSRYVGFSETCCPKRDRFGPFSENVVSHPEPSVPVRARLWAAYDVIQMRRWVWIACCSFAIGAGCRSSPNLVFQKGTSSDADYIARIFNAPIVVVGSIESDAFVRLTRQYGIHLQLRKLNVRVENVLRGDLVVGTTTVYYYTWAGAFNGLRPLGFWDEHGSRHRECRRILWLRRDSGVIRTACDGGDECTMPVESGTHLDYKTDPGLSLGYALADIFFTRGNGATDAEFARQVEWGAPSTVPNAYLFEKLQRLAATEVPIVREAACKQLSYYRQKCVEPSGKP